MCQKGGEPNSFARKVAAHATVDIVRDVANAPKQVRLPPFLMPVTDLLLSFPSRSESMHLFCVLKVSAQEVSSPKAARHHGVFALISLKSRVI